MKIPESIKESIKSNPNITEDEVVELIRPYYSPDYEDLVESALKDCVIDVLVDYINTSKKKQIKGYTTDQLIEELETREGVEKVSAGLYGQYELREKYTKRISENGVRGGVNAKSILIIKETAQEVPVQELTFDEYLKTILNPKQIREVKKAIKYKTPVLIKGIQGPTGKSVLKDLLRKQGVPAIEEYELKEDITMIELNKVIESPIAGIKDTISY